MVVGHYASFAGAGELVRAIRGLPGWTCDFIVSRKDEGTEFWRKYEALLWSELSRLDRWRLRRAIRRADVALVAGTCALDLWSRVALGGKDKRQDFSQKRLDKAVPKLASHCKRHRTAVIVTDSPFLEQPAWWQDVYARLEGLRVLAMPDKMPLFERGDVVPYWPPVEIPANVPERLRDTLRVGHSPSKASRRGVKGSDLIEDTCRKLGVHLEVVSGLSHDEAIERKRHFDLFIDQVPEFMFGETGWHGGVGKSGLEAMAFGCAVMASGSIAETEPVLPMPPILWTRFDRFEKDFAEALSDPERVRAAGRASRRWIEEVASPDAVVRHVLESLDIDL